MAIPKIRKAIMPEMEEEEIEEEEPQASAPVDFSSAIPLPGYPVRLVHGPKHRILLLADFDIPPELFNDFAAKSACEAWRVDFTDPELVARVEEWRNR